MITCEDTVGPRISWFGHCKYVEECRSWCILLVPSLGGAEVKEEGNLMFVRGKDLTGKWARVTFNILLSYHGGFFDGWQKQPGLNTVQGKSQMLKERGCAAVAGRTNKGVTAFRQVGSFYTWLKDIEPQEIKDAINCAGLGKMMVISVAEVSRDFHPNFSAKWRRCLYIFPFNEGEESGLYEGVQSNGYDFREVYAQSLHSNLTGVEDNGPEGDQDEMDIGIKPTSFEFGKVDRLVRQLEGKLLSYRIFARDTKASRNVGPPTECYLFHARATESSLPVKQDGTSTKVMCIELVGNRFLRKMVRVLVAKAVREAAGAEEDALRNTRGLQCHHWEGLNSIRMFICRHHEVCTIRLILSYKIRQKLALNVVWQESNAISKYGGREILELIHRAKNSFL